MELQNRIPLLKSAFKLLVKNLREKDKITIITYGGNVTIALESTSGKYQDSILRVIEEMEAGGDTPGESAINLAYNKAKQSFIKDGNNRVILATDGDFNVGIADEIELQRLISLQSQTGIYLTCLGVGMGNYKDSKLEILAKKGNGNFAYIDNETEGEKILVKEMTQTLYSVADNTFMGITFNSKYVKQYRLLGFDNKQNAIADTSSVLEGGQVGSGYSTIIMFEIEPTSLINFDNLEKVLDKDFATIQINYQNVENKKKEQLQYKCVINYLPILSLPKHYGFAAAVAMFGGYIKNSKFINGVMLDDISSLAKKSVNTNSVLQTEFLHLLAKAKPIYEITKKKKKKKRGME
jgi:Ca-activated chloride channel family protein